MSWIVSGPSRATVGQDVTQPGATGAAFRALIEEVADDRAFWLGDRQVVADAAFRATARWDGETDDGATPLFQSSRDVDDSRAGTPEILEIEGITAFVEPVFLAVMVPPGVEEVELSFVDDGMNAAFPSASGSWRNGLPMASDAAFVLVDCFIGSNTYRTTALQKVIDGFARIRVRVRNGVATLVGTVLRVSANGRAVGSRDVSWHSRLSKAQERYPTESTCYPRIDRVPAIGTSEIVVYVHGTLATCLPALATAGQFAQLPLFRFEHDTMRPIAENAEHLAEALVAAGEPEVRFVGHSRGGLVSLLAGSMYPKTNMVTTFGTPHAGTPLAAAMDGLLSYGVVALGIGTGTVIAGGLFAAIVGSVIPGGRIPDGWADMQPHSSFVRMLPHLNLPAVTAYGGVFDAAVDLGHGPLLGIEAARQFFGDPNDLVVPLASSCPPHFASFKLDQVHHFDYFSKDDLALWCALQKAMSP